MAHDTRERSQFTGEVAFYVARKATKFAADAHKRIGSPSFHLQDPFDPVLRPVWELETVYGDKKVLGGAMVVVGTGMLVPGAGDYIAGGLGVLAFRHPLGFVAGIAIYNITALGLVWVGYNWSEGNPTFQTPFS